MIVVRHILVSLTLSALSACADTTPLPFSGNVDAGPSDAGQVPPQVIEACRQCAIGDTSLCPVAYQECAVDERCLALLHCVIDIGCLAPSEIQDRIACVPPCFVKIGIQSGVDPSLQRVLAVNACTLPAGPCGNACVID